MALREKNNKTEFPSRYCPRCFEKTTESASVCPRCHYELSENLAGEEKTALVQGLHRRENKLRDVNDRALSCIILGAIFIVIGAIFFSLAYKLDLTNSSDNTRHLNVETFEFWTSSASLAGGGASFVYGLVQLIVDVRHLRVLKHDIAEIVRSGKATTSKTGLWITSFVHDLRVLSYNRKAIRAATKGHQSKK